MPIIDLLDPKLHISERKQKKRLLICNGDESTQLPKCDYQREKFGVQTCFLCGCILSMKTKLKTEGCPILKWNKEPI